MRGLIDALLDVLDDRVRTGAAASRVTDRDVQVDGVSEPVDAVVLACGAPTAADLLGPLAPGSLATIHSVSTGVVFLIFPSGSADALPDGTGFVVPRGEAPMTAATFVSRKWPDARFEDRAVVRCYVGGAGAEDLLDAPDGDIVGACARYLGAVLDLPVPEASHVHRWWRAMPQYELGHLDRVRRIREALRAGIFVVGNAFDGVGVSDLARAAEETAGQVLVHLGAPRKEPA
jgi:oxygen-dependent protoporphyrinogen oxidase